MPHFTETSINTPPSSAYSGATSGSSSTNNDPLDVFAIQQFLSQQTRGAGGDPWTPYSMSSDSTSNSSSTSTS